MRTSDESVASATTKIKKKKKPTRNHQVHLVVVQHRHQLVAVQVLVAHHRVPVPAVPAAAESAGPAAVLVAQQMI